ncbi:hypothetical protein [Mycolicibacterium thermoresistibile]|jgi:hypothetical protein|uniref:Lipoprotein n=1 Tax=Mycolicibacterium thermoresistibile TaxID=1797 RepID=A0A100XDY7_MYCTH|nr:hypothetical protein [Mycolicibacterium thermoresistibile]MCV7188965.1 hypothetical protein [Mycolicibacterium thermoresistibile]GAT14850.1 putative uncharacterized protein [Mycolicibacterium thermoresistibile]SNW20073.1 Uncharacterised protein [Mycolicibacterium thermoresistibile]
MRRPRLLLAACAALVAVGCSAGDPAPPETSSTTEDSTSHGAFAECLDRHGVPVPAGPAAGTPEGVDEQRWQQAMADCAEFAPGPAN